MELSSHLLRASVMDRYDVSEMRLAARLVEQVPDNSVTLFDRGSGRWGFCTTDTVRRKRHWLLPMKKGTKYEVVRTG
jgi:hypothetical protein